MTSRNPYMVSFELPSIEKKPRTPIYNETDRKRIRIAAALTAGAATLFACTGGDSEPAQPTIACNFSTETTVVVPGDNWGADTLALQIDGVTYDACLQSAKDKINELNPGLHVGAPRTDDQFHIPVSVSIVEG